jgi:hypothetical protein
MTQPHRPRRGAIVGAAGTAAVAEKFFANLQSRLIFCLRMREVPPASAASSVIFIGP